MGDGPASVESRQQTLENIKKNIAWLRNHKRTLAQWLLDNGFTV